MNPPLVVIVGPTASGKSALAMQVAKDFNGEIIAADSRTVYKGMDIGTAKPTAEDQRIINHHLIDVVEPGEAFSAAQFKDMATRAITTISRRGKLAVMVGGTGLYVDSVIFDYNFGIRADPTRRLELSAKDIHELQDICNKNNIPLPKNAKNKRHLVRAIELHGLVIHNKKRLRQNTIVVGMSTNKKELRDRITIRAHKMVEMGVLHETKKLADAYGWDNEAMTGNVYRILRPVLECQEALEPALEKFVISDLRLAKRQLTWLKRNNYIVWGNPKQLYLAIEHFVQQNNAIQSMPASLQSDTISVRKKL